MEFNIIYKKLRRGTVRVAFLYPSLYEVMASSLISHLIYFYVNEEFPEVYLERFHLNKLYGAEEELRSLETGSPLRDYGLIITSLHYEPNISGIVRALYYSGIDPRRGRRDQIVLAGGPAVIANPHPYSGIIDAFIIGEAENTIPRIIDLWIQHYDDREGFLEELSRFKDIYVPGYSDGKIYRSYVEDLDGAYYPIRQFQHPNREPVYGRGFLLETSRGCRFWCRFCIEGRLFKPYRVRSYGRLKKLIDEGLRINNYERVVFFSLIFLFSKHEKKLLEYMVDNGISFSVPSLRLEVVDDDTLHLIEGGGQKTLTVAPESLSYFPQRIIGKYFDLDMIMSKLKRIIEWGFNLKIYMISGFKGEGLEDIDRNINVLKSLAKHARQYNRRIAVTINPLIPKPKTPFQWIGMIELNRARSIINRYRRELPGIVDTRPLYVNWAWIQASIALGDHRLSDILVEWGIEGGSLGAWRRVLDRHGFDTSYIFRGYRFGEELPWDNIVLGEGVEDIGLVEYSVLERLLREGSGDLY